MGKELNSLNGFVQNIWVLEKSILDFFKNVLWGVEFKHFLVVFKIKVGLDIILSNT